MNTVLANANAEGRIPTSMFDVLYLENEAGYIIENLNPTAQGYYFAWDQNANKILYIMNDLQTVYYPEEYTVDPSVCWLTASTAEEMQLFAEKGFNIALECDISEPVVLSNVVSINTLGFTLSDITMNSGNIVVDKAELIGSFGTTTLNTGATNIKQSGVVNSLNIASGSANVTLGGYVSSYSAANGVASTVSSSGMIAQVTSASSIENKGVIKNSGSSSVTGKEAGVGTNAGNIVNVDSKDGIENVRAQVASGLRTFEGETIVLTEDINLNGIAFSPISSFYRKNSSDTSQVWDPDKGEYVKPDASKNWFAGKLDGNGKTIKNFANNGFSLSGITAGTNKTSVSFGSTKVTFNEAIYGLFASVYNAEIENLNVECDIDMIQDTANKMVGDSVGAIVGFATGDYLRITNCTVTGSVKGYDGVGGLVGRSYAKETTIKNCTNNANVTGARKTGGIVGYISCTGATVSFDNVVNNGTITNLGWQYDKETLQANDAGSKNGTSMYCAGAAYTGEYSYLGSGNYTGGGTNAAGGKILTGSIEGFTNNGSVIIGSETVGYLINK